MQLFAQMHPGDARQLLIASPQLAQALLQMLSVMDLIKPIDVQAMQQAPVSAAASAIPASSSSPVVPPVVSSAPIVGAMPPPSVAPVESGGAPLPPQSYGAPPPSAGDIPPSVCLFSPSLFVSFPCSL